MKKTIDSSQAREERTVSLPYTKVIRSLVRRARYKEALAKAKELRAKHPKNRFAAYHYAVMLGDCTVGLSKRKVAANAKTAASILRELLVRSKGIDFKTVGNWRNEYYWFSRQPYKQYRLGVEESRFGEKSGYYSMGVGAAMLSVNHLPERERLSKRWAQKSISAWERYFEAVPDYYNAYVWYAKALGLSGDIDAMEKALKKASRLSGRPLSYQEFSNARKEVLTALAKAKSKRK